MATEQQIAALVTLVTAAGASTQVLSGRIDMPEDGAWMTALEIDAAVAPARGDAITILVASQAPGEGDPAASLATFAGTVLWSAAWAGRSHLWVTGGKGGLRKLLERRNYVAGPLPIPLFDLIADICTETGEVLDDSVTAAALGGYTLGRWHRPAVTGLAALGRLCAEFGLVWRFTPAGKLLVLPLDYPVDPQQPYVTDPGDDGADRSFVVAPDKATLLPATTLLGKQVNRVVYEVTPDGLRATCFYGTSEAQDFEAAVRTVLPEIPFLESYEATVVEQRPTGLLEVLCDDARIGPLDNVVLLAGGPRMTLRAKHGQRVRVLFASGSPLRYYAVGFEQDAAATKGIARVGDSVDCGTLTGVAPPGGGPVTFIVTPPGGAPGMGATVAEIGGLITTGSPDQKLAPGTT